MIQLLVCMFTVWTDHLSSLDVYLRSPSPPACTLRKNYRLLHLTDRKPAPSAMYVLIKITMIKISSLGFRGTLQIDHCSINVPGKVKNKLDKILPFTCMPFTAINSLLAIPDRWRKCLSSLYAEIVFLKYPYNNIRPTVESTRTIIDR